MCRECSPCFSNYKPFPPRPLFNLQIAKTENLMLNPDGKVSYNKDFLQIRNASSKRPNVLNLLNLALDFTVKGTFLLEQRRIQSKNIKYKNKLKWLIFH